MLQKAGLKSSRGKVSPQKAALLPETWPQEKHGRNSKEHEGLLALSIEFRGFLRKSSFNRVLNNKCPARENINRWSSGQGSTDYK
jgi:hypothetical protein